MITLPVFFPNRRIDFTETGDVIDHKTGSSVGRWNAESSNPAEHNCLIFHDQSGSRQVLPAHYNLNAHNQLVVSLIPEDGAVTEKSEAAFNGSIEIDDEHDVIYALSDGPGSDTGQAVVMYGKLAFDGPKSLVLRMDGGDQTAIRSEEALPLSADENKDIDLAGQDLLVFFAATTNTYGTTIEHRNASISFAGQWKLWPEGLAFECSAQGDLTKPDLVLSLKGRSKAVAAGLEFRLKDNDIEALFVVEGRNTYDCGSATWSIAVGYSQLAKPEDRLKAAVSGKIIHTTGKGNALTIEGRLSYQGGGKTGALDLSLAAEYTFTAGKLVVKANASWAGSHYQYDLELSGEIKIRGGKLVFDVCYDSTHTVSLNVNYTGSDADFLKNFSIAIKRDSKGKVKATIGFTIKVAYLNGVQVIEPVAA